MDRVVDVEARVVVVLLVREDGKVRKVWNVLGRRGDLVWLVVEGVI